jgi:hypothetical protein
MDVSRRPTLRKSTGPAPQNPWQTRPSPQPSHRLRPRRVQNAANALASAVSAYNGVALAANAGHTAASGGGGGGPPAAPAAANAGSSFSAGGAAAVTSGPSSPTASPSAGAPGPTARMAPFASPPRRRVPGDLEVRLIPANLAREQEQRRRAEEERQREEEAMRAQMETVRTAQESGGMTDAPEWLRLINE